MGDKGEKRAYALLAAATATALMGWTVLVAHTAAASPARTGRAAERGTARTVGGSSAFDWPELHSNPQLGGYAANGTVTTANAAGLGVRWATDLYRAVLDSPVVAYDPVSGRTLGYVGTDAGDFFAIDMATGAIVWSVKLSGPVQASPVVSQGAVWVGTRTGATIYKLNASTGAVDCSQVMSSGNLFSSPVAVTPPGGTASVYFADLRSGANGMVLSVSAATCAIQWTFSGYHVAAGNWDPLSYAVDATGEPLLLFGTNNPDESAYAVDAVTGKEVWRFQVPGAGDIDIGSGLTISPPGVNGFTDGTAYVPDKNGFVYALDLTTGAERWVAGLGSGGGTQNESLSTAALDGTSLVVGDAVGVSDFNAITGAVLWRYQTPSTSQIAPPGPAEVVSSPAISGPAGQEVVALTDLSGAFRVLSLAAGAQLYHHRTGSWITSGPAVSGGDILFGSSDGFLYDMSAGSGNERPATAITSPADGATVANPGGALTVSGTAADSAGSARWWWRCARAAAAACGGTPPHQHGPRPRSTSRPPSPRRGLPRPAGVSRSRCRRRGRPTGWTPTRCRWTAPPRAQRPTTSSSSRPRPARPRSASRQALPPQPER